MRLALIGDIHGCWDEADNAYFSQAPVDLLLFTGDLAVFTGTRTFRVAETIVRLPKPFAMVAGNHDCVTMPAFLGELTHQDVLANLAAGRIVRHYRKLQAMLGARLVGYSTFEPGGVTVVGARPFAMEGGRISFRETARRLFGIDDAAASSARLADLILQARNPVVVLAHNGPAGLGVRRADMFGIDFRPGGGDNGDRDLAAALAATGDQVKLVVAGHMHHAVRGADRPRPTHGRLGNTLVVNAARVPRHTREGGYYICATMLNDRIALEEVSYERRAPWRETRRGLDDAPA